MIQAPDGGPMLLHTCAPPKDERPRGQTLWTCYLCGAVWEAVPTGAGIFDFDRSEVVARAEWIRLEEGPAALAG
ncbi:MAG TPA: hypothetical protein VF382_02865 [Actinomycetota bacterium]